MVANRKVNQARHTKAVTETANEKAIQNIVAYHHEILAEIEKIQKRTEKQDNKTLIPNRKKANKEKVAQL